MNKKLRALAAFLAATLLLTGSFLQVFAEENVEIPIIEELETKGLVTDLDANPAISAPAVVKVTQTGHAKLKVSYRAVRRAQGYIIFRSESEEGTYQCLNPDNFIKKTYYEDTSVEIGKRYFYKVRAVKDGAVGKDSVAASNCAIPYQPTGIKAEPQNYDSIMVSFQEQDRVDGYQIYRSNKSNKNFELLAEKESLWKTTSSLNGREVFEYVDQQGLQNGIKYYYYVQSFKYTDCNEAGILISKKSKVVNTYPRMEATSSVSVAEIDYCRASISWNKVEKADYYYIYQSTKKTSGFKKVATVASDQTSYLHKTGTGRTYYYRIDAVKVNPFNKKIAGIPCISEGICLQTGVPGNLEVKCITYNSMKLSWDKVDGANRYYIYRQEGTLSENGVITTPLNGQAKKIAVSTAKPDKVTGKISFVDKRVSNGKAYSYYVVSYRGGARGRVSLPDSDYVRIAAPAPVVTNAGLHQLKITIPKVAGATAYYISRYHSKTNQYEELQTLPYNSKKTTYTYTDTNLIPGQEYQYQVHTERTDKYGKIKGEPSQTVTGTPRPLPITQVEAAYYETGKGATVTWKDAEADTDGITYHVFRAQSLNSSLAEWKDVGQVAAGNELSFSDETPLSDGTEGYYHVTAVFEGVRGEDATGKRFQNPTAITVAENLSVAVGKTKTLQVNFIPTTTTSRTLSFSSSDQTIATVSTKGIITGKKAGKSTITATSVNGKTSSCTITVTKVDEQMRAVWVPYYDITNFLANRNETDFTNIYSAMCDKAKEQGCNTMVVHVSAFHDRIYKRSNASSYQWSTKMMGSEPSYDPLSIMVSITHQKGMEFHAWVNPYRTSTFSYPSDAAMPGLKDSIVQNVSDICAYQVDAIHFDDYFYPGTSKESISTKKNVVNSMVRSVYQKANSNGVKFGISPQGNIENCRAMGADVDTWLSSSGYVDYICPQLYWSDNWGSNGGITMFTNRMAQWKSLNKNGTTMYVGLALYKAGEQIAGDLGWSTSSTNLKRQADILENAGCKGYFLFTFSSFYDAKKAQELSNLRNR